MFVYIGECYQFVFRIFDFACVSNGSCCCCIFFFFIFFGCLTFFLLIGSASSVLRVAFASFIFDIIELRHRINFAQKVHTIE